MVTIASYSNIEAAYVARSFLESRNIEAMIPNEHSLRALPFLELSKRGVQLQVMDEDEERARAALAEVETAAEADDSSEGEKE